MKEIRKVHRAGLRIAAKKRVHKVGEKYQREHGQAFTAAAGRTFAASAEDHTPKKENPPTGQGKQ